MLTLIVDAPRDLRMYVENFRNIDAIVKFAKSEFGQIIGEDKARRRRHTLVDEAVALWTNHEASIGQQHEPDWQKYAKVCIIPWDQVGEAPEEV